MKPIDALTCPETAKDTYSSEEYFQRMLILERLRSKRTGKPFMLILLDIGKLTRGKRAEKAFVLRKLVAALKSSTSDIDVQGWYLRDSIIGIVCQDVPDEHRDRVARRIKDKLSEVGIFHLVGNNTDAINLLCLLYPDF